MDPLRPFADFVRSLWRARAGKIDRARAAPAADSGNSEASLQAGAAPLKSLVALEERLRGRLQAIGAEDSRRRQQAFVETVMLWELGEEVAQDQRFYETVTVIAEQIAAHQDISKRLGEILDGIATS